MYIKKTLIYNTAIMVCILLAFGCAKDTQYKYGERPKTPYPDTSFAVISDIHIYDPSLGSTGSAFEETMRSDRKLLLNSIDLLDYATKTIIKSGAKFVLISGDLTKDGESINHQLMAKKLKQLTSAGIAVYVVPGNHDINNPEAVRYDGDKTEPVASISAEDFAKIYGDFGFNAALMRDDDSLSYVAEPVKGLWLLCIDSCCYRENKPGGHETVDGKISQKTADWMASVLLAAADQNKAVIAVMHHGVVEHWKGQAKLHPKYLVNGYAAFGKFLASWNVRIAFTGHYHAQDITLGKFGDKFIYDIETGALVTAPCYIRHINMKDNIMHIRSEAIVDKIYPGTDFAVKSHAFVKRTVVLEAVKTLNKYMVSGKDAEYIADAIGDAFITHYDGDENTALRQPFDTSTLGLWSSFIYSRYKYALEGLWVDLSPADNNVSLDL